uniref:Uncharacterized protein n=1 Tax=Picea glauca TaxID=3330 RepID=A0A101M4M7_PICGL|nr:hypothetical protein ABT39_MTgene589 [Picea glauca]QHR87536.1 hypothetical protein Q903MT_gene1547 [Picea sitchensis]
MDPDLTSYFLGCLAKYHLFDFDAAGRLHPSLLAPFLPTSTTLRLPPAGCLFLLPLMPT